MKAEATADWWSKLVGGLVTRFTRADAAVKGVVDREGRVAIARLGNCSVVSRVKSSELEGRSNIDKPRLP